MKKRRYADGGKEKNVTKLDNNVIQDLQSTDTNFTGAVSRSSDIDHGKISRPGKKNLRSRKSSGNQTYPYF